MAAGKTLFWFVSLSFFIAGCGGYRTVSLPRIGEPGDRVRVTMQDGDIFRGDYVSHDTTALILEEEQTDTIDDGSTTTVRHVLPTLEVKTIARYESDGDGVILAVVGVVVVGVVVAGVAVGSQLNDGIGLGK